MTKSSIKLKYKNKAVVIGQALKEHLDKYESTAIELLGNTVEKWISKLSNPDEIRKLQGLVESDRQITSTSQEHSFTSHKNEQPITPDHQQGLDGVSRFIEKEKVPMSHTHEKINRGEIQGNTNKALNSTNHKASHSTSSTPQKHQDTHSNHGGYNNHGQTSHIPIVSV